MKEEMAIISDIHVGIRDTNQVICWFTVTMIGSGSLQIISIQEMVDLMQREGIYKLEDVNGKPCIVETDSGMCKFKRLLK
jgi:hypothetical protein